MGEEKSAIVMGNRDRELLIPVADAPGDGAAPSPSSSPADGSSHHSGRETFYKVVQSWASKKFMTGCVILFPIAVTFYITWWFIHFVDGFFSPIYTQLGIDIFGFSENLFVGLQQSQKYSSCCGSVFCDGLSVIAQDCRPG